MTRSIVGAALILVCRELGSAQVADKSPEFEVASVKLAPPDGTGDLVPRGGPGTSDPGQILYERTVLRNLVADAYAMRTAQVAGPDWISTEAYSIVAKIPPHTAKDQFNQMLQNLLAERFHLKIHHETKTLPVYVLSVAPGGTKLKPASVDTSAETAAADAPTCDARAENRFPTLRPGRSEAHLSCPGVVYYRYRQTMPEFALGLGTLVSMANGDGIIRGSPPAPFVVDETALTDRFEFTLEFAGSIFPSSSAQIAALVASGSLPRGFSPDSIPRSRGPELFDGLEKQLGLKLEKGKRPVDFLIIDHAERVPTEN